MNFRQLATTSTHAALQVRRDQRCGLRGRVCPYDLALRMGISVRFVAVPSLEGLYHADEPRLIVINVERPTGRRRYTCAHELGHHILGHGTRIDELVEGRSDTAFDPDEYAANRFAAALLMPKIAVNGAFAARGWAPAKASPEQMFIVAQTLGVGYRTLIGYLERTLSAIDGNAAKSLRRRQPKQLRPVIAGFSVPHDLFFVDQWTESIDAEVGDVLLIEDGVRALVDSSTLALVNEPRPHFVAASPGTSSVRLIGSNDSVAVRISRRTFTGLAKYRYLEE